MRVVFWGTPEFGLPTLRALLESEHQVAGVVTQPDRPAGRGRQLRPPPVKRLAQEQDVPVLQPEKPRGPEFMARFAELVPEVSVVAAYGEILQREVLDLPTLGSFNVHASLLPELRGAAPVNWAIIGGFQTTGVTIMRMVEALDAGPILLQRACPIRPGETAGALSDRLSELGAEALLEALTRIELGSVEERPQNEAEASYAPKLKPEDVHLDWALAADELERWIRGSDPWPGAWTKLDDSRVQLFQPEVLPRRAVERPGTVELADPRAGLEVACGQGVLRVGEVQPAGKRRMKAVEWIRGRGVQQGARFG